MKIRDYFLLGLSYNLDKKRHWVNSLISIVVEDTRPIEYPCKLIYEDDTLSFIHPETQERVYIDDYIPVENPSISEMPLNLNRTTSKTTKAMVQR